MRTLSTLLKPVENLAPLSLLFVVQGHPGAEGSWAGQEWAAASHCAERAATHLAQHLDPLDTGG